MSSLTPDQKFALAIMRFKKEGPQAPNLEYNEILIAIHGGWLRFDGEKLVESDCVTTN